MLKPYNLEIDKIRYYYDFCYDHYYGSNGMLDGTYLYKYPRELDYPSRLKMSTYLNLIKPIVDSTITPVFSELAVRESNNLIYDAFTQDVDTNNTLLQTKVKNILTMSELLGTCFVVMDNFGDLDSMSQGEVIETRLYPYIYIQLPQSVVDYEVDEFGKLIDITFIHSVDEANNLVYKNWTHSNIQSYYYTTDAKGTKTKIMKSSIEHALGVLPVIQVKSSTMDYTLPIPPYYDLCQLNNSIYNLKSEIRDLERTQSFSILVLPGTEPDTDITVGNSNVIYVDQDSTQFPAYISPDSSILSTLQDCINSDIDHLLKNADILGSTSLSLGSGNESGVSKAYTFAGQNYKLLSNSMIATAIETRISYLFGLFIKQDIVSTVAYPTNFQPSSTELQYQLDTFDDILKNFGDGMSEDSKNSIYKSIDIIVAKLIS